jgi:hypothetical protein
MADVAASAPAEPTSTTVAADTAATSSPSTTETPPVTSTESTGDMVSAAAEIYQRLAAEEPPPSAPSPSTPPAQAATAPAPTPETPADATTRGPIPFDRHQAVLTRTRNEVGAEARKKTLAEFGIAEGVTPQVVAHGIGLARMLTENPKLFLQIVQSQLGVDAAPAAAAAPKPAEDPEPEPDIPLADGRSTFSADQLRAWHQWHERKLQAQMDEKYGPIRDAHEQQTLTAARQREAQSLVSAAAKWPMFDKLRPHVKAIIAAQTGPLTQTSLHDAYITAYRDHGQKMLREEWEAERSGQLTRKASASTVQPGAPRPSTPRPDSELTTREIIRQEARRLAAG